MPRFSLFVFVFILLISLLSVLNLFKDFVDSIIMALVVVSIFMPVHLTISKKIKNEYAAALTSTSLVFLGVLIPMLVFLMALIRQGLMLFKSSNEFTKTVDFTRFIDALRTKLLGVQDYLAIFDINLSTQKIISALTSFTQYIATFIYNNLSTIASNVFSLGFNFILTVVLVFVFLKSGKALRAFVIDLLPLPQSDLERLMNKFKELASAVFLGNGIISILEGVIGGLLIYYFNISGALILGFCMALLAFLPLIGAAGVVIPVSLYLYLTDRPDDAIIFLILNSIQIFILEMIIKSKVVGKKSQMHEVVVFLSIISAVKIYGMLGIFYGPLLVTMFLSLASIYRDHYQRQLLSKTKAE